METTIDKAGRLVLPKAVREASRLYPGTRVRFRVRDRRYASSIADTTSSWVGWRPLAAFEYTSRPSAMTSNRPPPDGIISMSTPWNRFLRVAAKLTALGL